MLIARRHCDVMGDITSLGNPGRRAETEEVLSRLLDVNMSLGDYEQPVDYSKRIIQSPMDCRKMIDELLERCLCEIDASGDEPEARCLMVATRDAYKSFVAYAPGACEMIEQNAVRIVDLRDALESLRNWVRDLENQVARQGHEAAALREAAEA